MVHGESAGKPNMMFCMHPSGLHCFNLNCKDFMFANTVTENKKEFTK